MKTYKQVLEDEDKQLRAMRRRRRWDMVALATVLAFFLSVFLCSCATTTPVAATGPVDGTKEGRVTCVAVLGMAVANADAGVKRAAAAGGVRFVQTVDVRRSSILGLVTFTTTIVTGE